MSTYRKYTNHRKIWSDHFGPIPKEPCGRSYEIHHKDGDYTNNSIDNLVCLTIQEHYEVHFSQGDEYACWMILQRLGDDSLRATSLPAHNKGKQAWNDGQRVKYADECPGEGWAKGDLQKGKKGATADKVVWNNGKTTRYAIVCPGEGWEPGALPRPGAGPKKGSTRWTDGTTNKISIGSPGTGYYKGWTVVSSEPTEHSTEGLTLYNNGTINKYFDADPGGEWEKGSLKKGMTSNIKGRKAYNNGNEVKFFTEAPSDPQWVLGDLPQKRNHLNPNSANYQ
jgi:hypothetical protein